MSGRVTGIPTGVHVVLEGADGKVLLMRRAGTGFFDGLYSLPGGHVEHGESVRATAVRELAEELGLVLEVQDVDVLGVVHRRSDTNRIDFIVRARRWRGVPSILEPDKCDDLLWSDRQCLPEATVPYVREALARQEGQWIFESGWGEAG